MALPRRLRHYDAHRRGDLDRLAGGPEQAAGRVDVEDGHVVGVLVGGQEAAAGRVDGEASRGLALSGLVAREAEFARQSVDGENRNAVMPAVRAVNELARRVDGDLGREADPLEPLGQGRDAFEAFEGPAAAS